jgi:hypothetical protein
VTQEAPEPLLCPHCDEPVEDIFDLIPHLDTQGIIKPLAWHRECWTRNLIGGLNHLRGTCQCCGGSDPPDPPWLSRRDAARAAVAEYRARQ